MLYFYIYSNIFRTVRFLLIIIPTEEQAEGLI